VTSDVQGSSPHVDTRCQSPMLDAVVLTYISMPNTPTYILYHNVGPRRHVFADNVGSIAACLWARGITFVGRYR
jgi:hypothetical protein